MPESGEEFQCFDCGRSFLSLRALHAHESLTEIPKITKRLCDEAPGRCRRNWISGRCESHTDEARRLVRLGQRLRYEKAGRTLPKPLRAEKRQPALARLVEAFES